MVFITEDLLRKRAEHNNSEITTLEELSLHQSDIERIEYLDKWCRELKILYLQSNLIPKIENLSRLKKLEYLNLALNNILEIENLEGCESLTKLDLTVNFIARATSIEKLAVNHFLRDLYLVGNPCSDYIGYRDYVIAALPQLTQLDGIEISRSERLKAMQCFTSLRCDVLRQEEKYLNKLKKEKAEEENLQVNEGKPGFKKDWYTDTDKAHVEEVIDKNSIPKVESEDDFWNKPTKYTPECRLEAHRYMEEKRKEKEDYRTGYPDPNPPNRKIRFFNDEGRPMNINQANLKFSLDEDDEKGEYILDVACYKHLDTSLIDADIQPTYVRVTVKEKVLQLVLFEEVCPDLSTAQRSQVTGHLVLTLPKMESVLNGSWKKEKKVALKSSAERTNVESKKNGVNGNQKVNTKSKGMEKHFEKLEVGMKDSNVDIYNIVQKKEKPTLSTKEILFSGKKRNVVKNDLYVKAEEEFVDDLDVPPLE